MSSPQTGGDAGQGLPWPAATRSLLLQANKFLAGQQEALAVPLLQEAISQLQDGSLQMEVSHRLLRALIKLGRLSEARAGVARCLASSPVPAPAWLEAMAWRINAQWWEPIQSERLRIRRIQGADAQWLKAIFASGSFGSSVNRDYSARIHAMATEQVAHQLSQQFALPPADIGALVLVIERANGDRLGMASFVGIDEPNRRAEFIIGFPGVPPHSWLVFQAGLLLAELAFSRLRLHKVSAVLYGDNPRLPELEHMLSRLGFSSEGVQRQHVRLPSGEFVDVHLWGGLSASVLQSQSVQKFTRRLLGQPSRMHPASPP